MPLLKVIKKCNKVFVIGSMQDSVKSYKMTFKDAMHINHHETSHRGSIPLESESLNAVILLHIKAHDRRVIGWERKFKLPSTMSQQSEQYQPLRVSTILEEAISSHIIDMFVYGSFTQAHVEQLKRLYKDLPNELSRFMFSSESVGEGDAEFKSYSRCGESNKNFIPHAFIISTATLGRMNDCTDSKSIVYPWKFQGKQLSVIGMRLILNCIHSLKLAAGNPSIVTGQPYEIASKLLGVSVPTLFKSIRE